MTTNDDAIKWHDKGVELFALGKYEEAVVNYEKALEIDPYYFDAWLAKGNAFLNQGVLYNEALQCYNKALEIDSHSAIAWYNKGLALWYLNKLDDALKSEDAALKLDGTLSDAWNVKGSICVALRRYNEAIKYSDKALELNPNAAYPWRNKGAAFEGLKNYKEAIRHYDKVLKLYPEFVNAWIDKGYVLFKLQKYEQAITYYDKALELDRNSDLAHQSKSAALLKLDRNDEALDYVDKGIKLNPNVRSLWSLKGTILQASGKYGEAEESFNTSIDLGLQEVGNLKFDEKAELAEKLIIVRRYSEGSYYARQALNEAQRAVFDDKAAWECILRFLLLSSYLLQADSTSQADSIGNLKEFTMGTAEFNRFVAAFKQLDEDFRAWDYWDFTALVSAIKGNEATLQTKFLLLSVIDLLKGDTDKHNLLSI